MIFLALTCNNSLIENCQFSPLQIDAHSNSALFKGIGRRFRIQPWYHCKVCFAVTDIAKRSCMCVCVLVMIVFVALLYEASKRLQIFSFSFESVLQNYQIVKVT